MGVEVRLSVPEFHQAVQSAMLRFTVSEAMKLNSANMTPGRTWVRRLQDEVLGCCGEMAVAKWGNKWFVPSVNTFHRIADFLDLEIRATSLEEGSLIVRDNDMEERKFILVTGEPPHLKLRGWMQGREAKRPEWRRHGGGSPAFFVPQSALNPMELL